MLPDLNVELQQRRVLGLTSLQAVRRLQKQILPAEATVAAKIRLKLQLLQDADWNVEARTSCSVKRDLQVGAMIQLGCHGGPVCKAVAGVLNSNNKDGQHASEVAGKHGKSVLFCCWTFKAKICVCCSTPVLARTLSWLLPL